jgi:hypothetical protein
MVVAADVPALASPWEWSSSDWAGLTFLVIVIAAYVAWRQVNEARRLREEQARPFVIIDFHAWSTIIDLTITNIGATLARDVEFYFPVPLETTHDDDRGTLMDLNVFKNGIPSLAPGKEIKMFFDQFPARLAAELPLTHNVQVSYRDPAGKRYSELMVLDLSMYIGTGGITRHDVHDIHKRLKEISDFMRKWTDFAGLKVMTRSDLTKRADGWEARDAGLAEASEAQESNGNDNSPQ